MIDQELLDVLACPWCLGDLVLKGDRLVCRRCEAAYGIERDIPNMLVEEAELHCALCHTAMAKANGVAVCGRCGRHYDMTRRIEGDPLAHAELFCPACQRRLLLRESQAVCSGCRASYPVENDIAMTLAVRATDAAR